ncbi:hypothetical protein ACQP2P_41920 [Dactylosporangium sp. CA-139114]|uniref:hypothetical protein n=1 Tax=Dactylosporangium sp. CA-139114 TaxID=3239931 RepID=UPI003D99CE02
MSTDDKDLLALREFRSALDAPPEGVLVKGRYRLAASEYRPPARRRQWLLVTAGAAAALAVVVGAGVAVRQAGGPVGDGGGQAPAERPAATGSPTDGGPADIPVAIGTRAPLDAKVIGDGGATHAKAVAAMDRLADAGASAQPMPVPAGQVLYVKTYNLSAGEQTYIHEVWLDPVAMVTLRVRRTDGTHTMDTPSTEEEIDQAAALPAGMYRPTAQFVAGLPTDPGQLLTYWRQWAQTEYPGRPADAMIWKDAFELIDYSEPFWTPQQRAVIYRALAKMPDVKATTAKIDNKPYDLVCMDRELNGSGSVDCWLFDSATGRHAGSAWPSKNLALNAGNVGLIDYGTQPRPAPGVLLSNPPKPSGSPKTK